MQALKFHTTWTSPPRNNKTTHTRQAASLHTYHDTPTAVNGDIFTHGARILKMHAPFCGGHLSLYDHKSTYTHVYVCWMEAGVDGRRKHTRTTIHRMARSTLCAFLPRNITKKGQPFCVCVSYEVIPRVLLAHTSPLRLCAVSLSQYLSNQYITIMLSLLFSLAYSRSFFLTNRR